MLEMVVMMVLAEHVHSTTQLDPGTQVHLFLAIGIAVAYLLVPFTALRRLPLLPVTRVSGAGLFTTCAITHVALALGVSHGNPWMLLSDLVQLVSVATFIFSLNRQVVWALRRRADLDREERHEG